MRHALTRPLVALTALALAGTAMTGCSADNSDSDADAVTLTVYTDQHKEFVEALTQAYTEKTGVDFDIQQDATVGQIQAEGKASPADVFLSEDPAPVAQLASAGLLEKLPDSTMDQVRPGLSSHENEWVAYAARARVLYVNPELIDEDDLPESLMDIVDDQYKGKFAWAPSGAFVATTQFLITTLGVDKTRAFLRKVKANGVNEQKNGNVRDTVEAGKHAMGLSNHYYWWIKAAEVGGPENMTSKIHHFPKVDPGNLVLSSGAGVLATGDHKEAAADFVAWLTDPDGGQKVIADGAVDVSAAQYPVGKGVDSSIVGSLDDIKSPTYDMDIYAKQEQARDLLKTLGMSS